MTRPPRAPWAPERLDRTGHDARVLTGSLRDVVHANDWFGGTRSLRLALAPLLRRSPQTLLDVGTGSGDVVRGLVRWAARRGTSLRATAVDLHPDILTVARTAGDDLTLVRADMRTLPFRDGAFDLVLATLALHHVPDDAQVGALRELARVARRAVLIAELERTRLHWLSARVLAATLWRGNAVTRHDAPISVLRGYAPAELHALAAAANLAARTRRHPFFRLIMAVDIAASKRGEFEIP